MAFWSQVAVQVQGRLQVAPIFNNRCILNPGCVGLFAVGGFHDGDTVGPVIPMNSTVKISAPLLHHPSAKRTPTTSRVPRVQRAKAAKGKKKSTSRGRAASENDIRGAESEHEEISVETTAAVAEWKFYPMMESPKPFK